MKRRTLRTWRTSGRYAVVSLNTAGSAYVVIDTRTGHEITREARLWTALRMAHDLAMYHRP